MRLSDFLITWALTKIHFSFNSAMMMCEGSLLQFLGQEVGYFSEWPNFPPPLFVTVRCLQRGRRDFLLIITWQQSCRFQKIQLDLFEYCFIIIIINEWKLHILEAYEWLRYAVAWWEQLDKVTKQKSIFNLIDESSVVG